jgi:ferredoxin-nitrate reductase
MTNSERRVTYCPAFRTPPGQARPDWAIFAELGRRLGFEAQFSYDSSAEVFAEFAASTAGRVCDLSGLSHELLVEHGPQQWPFPAGTSPGAGMPRLYTDGRFPTPSGRARLIAEQPMGLGEPPDATYPLVLTVGRYLGHWHTMTRTVHVPRLMQQYPEPVLEVHPGDAEAHGLVNGAMVRVRSRRGAVTAKLRITERIRPGTVFLPMHWGASQDHACEANRLMHELGCPISQQPELKAAAVTLEPDEPPA